MLKKTFFTAFFMNQESEVLRLKSLLQQEKEMYTSMNSSIVEQNVKLLESQTKLHYRNLELLSRVEELLEQNAILSSRCEELKKENEFLRCEIPEIIRNALTNKTIDSQIPKKKQRKEASK